MFVRCTCGVFLCATDVLCLRAGVPLEWSSGLVAGNETDTLLKQVKYCPVWYVTTGLLRNSPPPPSTTSGVKRSYDSVKFTRERDKQQTEFSVGKRGGKIPHAVSLGACR